MSSIENFPQSAKRQSLEKQIQFLCFQFSDKYFQSQYVCAKLLELHTWKYEAQEMQFLFVKIMI